MQINEVCVLALVQGRSHDISIDHSSCFLSTPKCMQSIWMPKGEQELEESLAMCLKYFQSLFAKELKVYQISRHEYASSVTQSFWYNDVDYTLSCKLLSQMVWIINSLGCRKFKFFLVPIACPSWSGHSWDTSWAKIEGEIHSATGKPLRYTPVSCCCFFPTPSRWCLKYFHAAETSQWFRFLGRADFLGLPW